MKSKLKILLVDDDVLFRNVLCRALIYSGYDVFPAGNGREALAEYRLSPADLVLTDIVMPDKEGLETIGELRRLNPAAKIIAMSGGGLMNPKDYLLLARKMGVAATLQKPFTHEELLKTLESVLSPGDPPQAAAGV